VSPLALVTPDDLAEERAALAREAPPPAPVDRAAAMELEAAALLRLASAARELAVARAYAAQLGLAQWCTRCDEIMPHSRSQPTCSRCSALASKARWQRDARAEARRTAAPTSTTTQEP
jgi:hypothetical protein